MVRDIRARRVAGFSLTSGNAARLTEFYCRAFGARHVSSEHLSGAPFEARMGVRGGALCHTLRLGDDAVEILQFATPGRPYPCPLSPDDTVFQHFALVVSDMDVALSQLRRASGWTPISIGGPQRLPPRSGGVTAFKIQDPDGHPLELLAFPEHAVPPHWRERSAFGIFMGIDHSAMSVRDTAISTAFYQSLGFAVTAQTLNRGQEQTNLDGMPNSQVEVTALSLDPPTPHLELLCYRSEARPSHRVISSNDVASTRIVLAADVPTSNRDPTPTLVFDPDGHHLLLLPLLSSPGAR